MELDQWRTINAAYYSKTLRERPFKGDREKRSLEADGFYEQVLKYNRFQLEITRATKNVVFIDR